MMDSFDISIAYISWENGGKRRPVLIISSSTEYTQVFSITSKYSQKSYAIKSRYYKINDWEQAGLATASYIDTMTSIEIPSGRLSPPIGRLSDRDKLCLMQFLNKL